MSADTTALDVAEWAAACHGRVRDLLSGHGHAPGLLRRDPVVAARVLAESLAREIPALLDGEEWTRLHGLLAACLGELLIGLHGARWAWLDDSASPTGGRWVVTGFAPRPAAAVDVASLADDALASQPAVGLLVLIDRAERSAGVRAVLR
ncbi:hypothetical protein PV703_04440 [Streptomyces sp. ME01-24h]|nr:hypothetical protein [Streptomyces sp. ME19-03-3]MDX3352585.1 hypothetical protein [Streptomyces sp. ME01-24h]